MSIKYQIRSISFEKKRFIFQDRSISVKNIKQQFKKAFEKEEKKEKEKE